MTGAGDITIASAVGAEGGRVPDDAELIEKVEALPWREPWVESSNVSRIAWCESGKVPFTLRQAPLMADNEEELLAELDERSRQRTVPGDPGLPLGWLWVQFKGSKVYVYEDVPRPLFFAVLRAESPGGAHHELIKGRYGCAGVDLQSGRTWGAR